MKFGIASRLSVLLAVVVTVGLLTVAFLLRRYSEELDKRRQDETGMPAV